MAYPILFASLDAPEIIYGLVDPRDPERVRYVGRTSNPQVRHQNHCREKSAVRLRAWVAALASSGLVPSMVLLESTASSHLGRSGEVSDREGRWIARLRESGAADLNVRLGRVSDAND